MIRPRPGRSIPLALFCLAIVVGQGAAVPPPVQGAGPSVAIISPPPGSTVVVDARFRLGWTESTTAGAPIVGRTVVEYHAPVPSNRNCTQAAYSVAWTNTSANSPFRFPIAGFVAGTCYYWLVTVTDANGATATARSGHVLGSMAAGPTVSTAFPAPGALTDVPPGGSYTVAWTESGTVGVTGRTVIEESAPMPAPRSCAAVIWSPSRTFSPTGQEVAVTGHLDWTCYRYTIAITDATGRTARAVSGPLLVTSAPPTCAYGDVLTMYRAPADWSRSLLDPTYRLPSGYAPAELRNTTGISRMGGTHRISSLAYADLKALADAARAAGVPIDLTSAYRTHAQQRATHDYYVDALGPSGGLLRAARPGHSEHQLGTAIDVKAHNGPSPSNYTDWTTTRTGAWMRDNAWRYGWVMSYPKAASPARTCYQYEPWHFRYVGRTLAKAVHDSRLSLREYLWRERSLAPGPGAVGEAPRTNRRRRAPTSRPG